MSISILLIIINICVVNFHFDHMYFLQNPDLFLVVKYSLLLLLLILAYRRVVELIQKKRLSSIKLSGFTFLFIWIVLEAIFMNVKRSHHAEMSYASILWQRGCYHLNENSWRDTSLETKNKKKPALVFSGDSFTAGYGLNKVNERYSDVVGNYFRSEFEFYNIGLKGTGLKTAYEEISKVPNERKILIYQIYLNDLDDFCHRTMNQLNLDLYYNVTKYDRYIAKSSFVLNYLYFMVDNKRLIKEYFAFFKNCSKSQELSKEYFSYLDKFIKQAQNNGYEQIILLFIPVLVNTEYSLKFEKELYQYSSLKKEVTFVSITKDIEDLPLRKRIVNNQDTHASKEVNRIIVYKLLDILL